MPRASARLALMAFALGPWTAGCGSDAPAPSSELGVAWELAEHRAATLSGLAYRIELRIPEAATARIEGTSRIGFTWHDPDGAPLVLDFMDPNERVRAVRVNGADAPWTTDNDHLLIDASALSDGVNQVEVDYVAGDEALNRSDDFLYALFVPDRAHFSLPVFDQPNLKGTVEWTLDVPAGWRMLANGPAGERTEEGDRARRTFGPSRALPTYLFAFVAGDFQVEEETLDGRELTMLHRETDPDKVARNRDEIFRLHARALEWLEEYTGIDYPFQRFAFALIPSFQYGGMEHPGAILYRQAGLMLDEAATQGQLLGRASVISHETAHMWFGDLVTMNWFDDVWTKEVFANFMAAKIVQPSFPEVDHDLRFLMANHPSAYGVDRTAGANAIRQPLENLREAGTLYGSIIYQKAPVVMRQLEARVGETSFRDGLREYLGRHAYGNATWPDLIDILDARSDQDLAAWSRVWVDEPGRPRVVVTREDDAVALTPQDPSGGGRVWPQTVTALVGGAGGVETRTVELGDRPIRLEGAGDAAFVLPNGTGLEYGDFVLDSASQAWLVDHVDKLDSPLHRGAAWVTLWDQVLDGRLDPDRFLDAALDALAVEPVELVVSRILGYVREGWWSLLDPEARAALAPRVERVLWDGATGSRPRTARAAFLSTYRGTATTEGGVARLMGLWDGSVTVAGLPMSESDRIALAEELALRGVADAEAVLDAQEGEIDNPDRLARFRFVRPSLSPDPAVRQAFFDSLADPANREREPWALDGLGNLTHPLRADEGRAFLRPALDLLEEVQRTGDIFFPGRWLDVAVGGHGSPEAAETVQAFLRETPDLPPRLRAKVLQSADALDRRARIVHGWSGGEG